MASIVVVAMMMPPVMAIIPMMIVAVAPVIAVAVVPVPMSVVVMVAMAPVTMVPPMLPIADAVDEPARLAGRRRCRQGAGTRGHAAQAEH